MSIFGGADNDRIIDKGKQTTIKAGTGNDTITLADKSNALIQYASGDGNDVIRNFSESDTIVVSSATITGGIAVAYYKEMPDQLVSAIEANLTPDMEDVCKRFGMAYSC